MELCECKDIYLPAIAEMAFYDINTLEDAVEFTAEELLTINNVGTKTVEKLSNLAEEHIPELWQQSTLRKSLCNTSKGIFFDVLNGNTTDLCKALSKDDGITQVSVVADCEEVLFNLNGSQVYVESNSKGDSIALVFNKDFDNCRFYVKKVS